MAKPDQALLQEFLAFDADADLTCEELWTFFQEVVQSGELTAMRKAAFLRQLPATMEAVFHLRKCHHIERSGRSVRGFRGVGIRMDTCSPATPEIKPQ